MLDKAKRIADAKERMRNRWPDRDEMETKAMLEGFAGKTLEQIRNGYLEAAGLKPQDDEDTCKEQQIGVENHFRDTSYLWKEPELHKSTLSKEELGLEYSRYGIEDHYLNHDVHKLSEGFRKSKNEAIEYELKSYLETVYNIDCSKLEQYIKTCKNIKLKGVDIHSDLFPNGVNHWYDKGVLIFTTSEELQGTVFNFIINRFWRDA